MKNCNDCKHALWKRTEAGKLHPSGDGRCKYPWKSPALPVAFYWIGRAAQEPCGGQINRKKENTEHCAYWARVA